MSVSLLVGCSVNKDKLKQDPDKINIVCTTFPQYDWMRQVIKGNEDRIELKLLIDNGVDIHSYQATVDDIIILSECDLIVYVGGESDSWVDDAIKQSANPDLKTINMMDTLGDMVKEEEFVEGMQEEEEGADEDGHKHDHVEYDEHVWLSLRNAEYIVEKMADDYGISYYAAFVGCSAETEASFETVTFLANKIDELSLDYVLVIENSDTKLAQTIIDSSSKKNVQIMTLDSIQSVNRNDIDAGVSYLEIMENNLQVLQTVLE